MGDPLYSPKNMHEIFENKVAWNERLWRYFTIERFIALMDSSSVYFAAATQFEDNFEGAVSVQSPEYKIDPRYAQMEQTEKAFFELKRLTKISCWHRANYESDAMWKLYAQARKGIAICTTPEKMKNAFQPFRLKPEYQPETIYAGPVQYTDLTKTRLNLSMLERFFYKHMAFSWEQEFRLSISLRIAEEFGVNVPTNGINVSADIDTLIEHIILGPSLASDEKEKICELAKNHGMDNKIEISTLLYSPRYI